MVKERQRYLLRRGDSGRTDSDEATKRDALLEMLDDDHVEEWERREEHKNQL